MPKKNKWLFLRGLTREQRHWWDFPEIFKRYFPQDEILFLDLPGAGVNCRVPAPTNLSDYVDFFREQLCLHPQEKINILTVSLGGMIAIDWAHRFSHELEKMVIMNTSSPALSPFYHRLLVRNYWRILRSPFLKDLEERERVILDMTVNLRTDKKLMAKTYASYAKEYPLSTRSFVNQLWAAMHFKMPSSPVKVPLLLLNSLGDRFVHPSCTARLAQKWRAPLYTHPTAGHDLAIDAGSWVCERIQSHQFSEKRA